MPCLVRTGLTLCSLLALPSVAHAEPGVETAVRDTFLNANCSLTDYGASGDLFIGKSGEYDLGTCGPGTGVAAVNRQRPMVMFDLREWIPGSLTNVVFDINQQEALLAVESASICTSSEELIDGAVWDDEPICDNPRETRGAAAYYLHHPSDPAGSNGPDTGGLYPLAQGPTYATGTLFETDLALSMGNGSGFVTLSIYSSFSNEIPATDHYASLESPSGIFPTLTFDGVLKECDVAAECDDADICNGAEACDEYVCVDGTDAPDGTVCPDGECQAGACVALSEDPLPQSYIDLGVCGDPGTSLHDECVGIDAFCPCALPGGYGGALSEYGGGHWFWGPWSFFNCGAEYVDALEDAGTPMTESLRISLRDAYWPGNSINDACWAVP